MSSDKPESSEPEHDETEAKSDDLKDRFRDALNRKRAHHDVNAPSNRGEPKVHEVHGSTTRKRQFRRKSG